MPLTKPQRVTNNPIMSDKWDEITEGREFDPIHSTTIEALCFWYAVLATCQEDVIFEDGLHVAFANDYGDIKSMPQLATAKQATDQIRQLQKQLGINDEVKSTETAKPKETALYVIQTNRQARAKAVRATRSA